MHLILYIIIKNLKKKNIILNSVSRHAVDIKDRYKVVAHKTLSVGDTVLIGDGFNKPANYPMGIIGEIDINIKEVTGVTLFKETTREIVKRHISQLILLLTPRLENENEMNDYRIQTQN